MFNIFCEDVGACTKVMQVLFYYVYSQTNQEAVFVCSCEGLTCTIPIPIFQYSQSSCHNVIACVIAIPLSLQCIATVVSV